jgi:hypothetical protein
MVRAYPLGAYKAGGVTFSNPHATWGINMRPAI